MSFADAFRQHSRNRPTKLALIDGPRRIDFATLDRLIDGAAHALSSLGIAPGQLVGVALQDHADHVVTLLALARMGAVTLPMDCRWHPHEKLSMSRQFGADNVLLEHGDPALAQEIPTWHRRPDPVESAQLYDAPDVGPD